MSARDDWFRSSGWSTDDQEEFYRRLARARPHTRQQAKRIKGWTLLQTDDPVRRAAGRDLLQSNIDDPSVPTHGKVTAHGMLARAAKEDGQLDDAETHFRAALAMAGPGGSGTNGEEETDLAEILLTRDTVEATLEAKSLLERSAEEMPIFPQSQFRLYVAMSQVHIRLGDTAQASHWAQRALDVSRLTDSGLANHPRLGLVSTDKDVLEWLTRVALSPNGNPSEDH